MTTETIEEPTPETQPDAAATTEEPAASIEEPTAENPPDTTATLAAGNLACCDCGVAVEVTPGSEVIRMDTLGPVRAIPTQNPRSGTLEFTRCADCAESTRMAEEAVAAEPSIVARYGSASAVHQLTSAILALRVLGKPAPAQPDRTTIRQLIHHFAAPGSSIRWSSRFAPVVVTGARPGTCAAKPFSHVGTELLENTRAAYVEWLNERVARLAAGPVVLTPPPSPDNLRGCILCGVGRIIVDAAEVVAFGGPDAARSVAWSPVTIATPPVIGAPGSPEAVRGFACPPCAEAIDYIGSVGQGSMERALRVHLHEAGREAELQRLSGGAETTIDGLISWAGVVLRARRRNRPEPSPNRQPWSHLRVE